MEGGLEHAVKIGRLETQDIQLEGLARHFAAAAIYGSGWDISPSFSEKEIRFAGIGIAACLIDADANHFVALVTTTHPGLSSVPPEVTYAIVFC